MPPNRRQVAVGLFAGALASPLLTASANGQGLPGFLVPTPSCSDDDEVTPAQTEGPYFTANSPLRNDFTEDDSGGQLLIGGTVVDIACRPISGAMLELWHADADGSYDNDGYRYRGHGFSDDQGRWWFATIVPGLHPGRTRHYHIKVQRSGGETLTTQLYFPDEQRNRQDRIFDPELLLQLKQEGDTAIGLFDFVLD